MASAPLTLMQGLDYQGMLQLADPPGTYSLVVRYPAAELTSAPVTVDLVTPMLAIAIPSAPNRPQTDGGTVYVDPEPGYEAAWRRDEELRILLYSPARNIDSVDRIAVRVGNDAERLYTHTELPASQCPAATGFCAEVRVKLWEPEMNSFRGDLTVEVDATLTGTGPSTAISTAKVTRWKWAHDVGSTVRASPAIATDGTIVVGSESGPTSGEVVALRHDGTIRWRSPLGAVVASPLIGAAPQGAAVYAGANLPDGGVVYRLTPGDGGIDLQCGPFPGSSVEASPVLQEHGSGREAVTTVLNGLAQLVKVDFPGANCPRASAAPAVFPMNVVRNANGVFFGDADGGVRAYDPVGNVWTPKAAWTVGAWGTIQGTALTGDDLVWAHAAGIARYDTMTKAGGQIAASSQPHWAPSIGAPDLLTTGTSGGVLHQLALTSLQKQTPANPTGIIRSAPLHGRDGTIYTSAAGGTIAAWERGAAAPSWTVPGILGSESSPAIDCTRDPSGAAVPGAPGVLYVAASNGVLHAFVVDSRGLDVLAPWPKYQHDPHNTGNVDTPLAPFACP